ncbi:MAG TPA: ornithine cyclodeaminase family protein [Bryobacteraceae bacterium]|nr:ornithine cyclodeaminase family protein [Bryobacteraceae bacterium]
MKILTFTEAEVQAALPLSTAIDCLRSAFRAFGQGLAQNQPRRRLVLSTGSVLHSMAASYDKYYGTKVYSTNIKHGAYFTFLLYDAATGRPLAQFEANHLGQIRTGAASGLAADILAPHRPLEVGIIGSGFQARTQIAALRAVRQTARIRVYSRSAWHRERFAEELECEAVSSAAAACDGADVIITATHSKDPVVPAEAVSRDALILAMGANMANRREIPPEIIRRARIVVDDIDQCKIEAGDMLLAGVCWSEVESLGELLAKGAKPDSQARLTVFKSVGIALEDVAVAAHIYEKAILAQTSADPSLSRR